MIEHDNDQIVIRDLPDNLQNNGNARVKRTSRPQIEILPYLEEKICDDLCLKKERLHENGL